MSSAAVTDPDAAPGPELSTVADDEVVIHIGADVRHWIDLDADTEYELEGLSVRTLARPAGERLATLATVNDVHFGEVECGLVEGMDIGPVIRAAPGEPPYPETMNGAAVSEMAGLDDGNGPDAVIAKGDLTTRGTPEEYQSFLDHYQSAFGDRLVHVRGNHDAYEGQTYASDAPREVVLPGVVVAVLDTVIPRATTGQVSSDQLEWLDELGSRADRPVLVFGHHQPWSPASPTRSADYFGINPDDSDRLVAVFQRRPRLVGYFAGHTHRNRVRRFEATGTVPWVEVASVKDYPGSWAEYRVFEGGILQIHRRISAPDALNWTERTRAMFFGLYAPYAFGSLDDRCFAVC